MIPLRGLSEGALFVTVPRVLNGASAIVVNMWALQHLTPGAYGVFAFCAACLLLFDGLVCSALDLGVLRRDASQRPTGTLTFTPVERAAIAMKAAASALLVALALLLGEPFGRAAFAAAGGRRLFALAALGAGALLLLHSVQVHFQTLHRFRAYGGTELAHTLARLGLVALVIRTGYASTFTMVGAYALAPALVSAGFARWMWRRRGRGAWLSGSEVAPLARFAATAFLTLGLGAIIARLDLFFLGFFSTPVELGIFGAALALAMVPEFLGFYLAPVMTPRIAAYLREGTFRRFMWRCQAALGFTCLGLLLAGLLALGPVAGVLLPPHFAPSLDVARVLLPGSITGLFLFPLTFNFVLMANPRALILIDCVAIPVLLVAYAVASARGGALGVAWVTSVFKIAKAIAVQVIAARAAREADARGVDNADTERPSAARRLVAKGQAMKMWTRIAIMTAVAIVVTTAAAAQAPEEVRAMAVPPVTDADDGSYRLGAGDLIEIKFIQNPELNELVRIRPDGRISMALVGELQVAGVTITDLATRLTTAYASTLRAPSAIIQVREFADRRVFVGGEVIRPGMLPLVGRQTALGAVIEAGGFKASSARGEVIVIRKGDDDRPRIIRLSMKSAQDTGPEAASFRLQPLDVVLVAESAVARAGRAVDQYVRQMIPVLLTGGFTYLFDGSLLGRR